MTFKWQKKLKSVLIDTLLLSWVYSQLFLTFTSSPKTEFLDRKPTFEPVSGPSSRLQSQNFKQIYFFE